MSIKTKVCKTCDALSNVPVIGGILKPKPRVSLIRMSGVIADSGARRGSISFNRYEKAIRDAFDEFDLKAVILVINSPGGSPAQCELIGNHIRKLSEEKDVPVYAFVEDVAASGGYWIACAADEIYTNESSIVGSIGVISASFGFPELIKRYGVERRVQASGKDKSFMDPFLELDPEDAKRLSELQKELHAQFIDWVKTRRGEKLTGKDKELFEGRFWTAPTALELGLIDGFGEARSFAKEKFGEDIKIVEHSGDKKLVPSLLGADAKANMPEALYNIVEDRAVWGRYGL